MLQWGPCHIPPKKKEEEEVNQSNILWAHNILWLPRPWDISNSKGSYSKERHNSGLQVCASPLSRLRLELVGLFRGQGAHEEANGAAQNQEVPMEKLLWLGQKWLNLLPFPTKKLNATAWKLEFNAVSMLEQAASSARNNAFLMVSTKTQTPLADPKHHQNTPAHKTGKPHQHTHTLPPWARLAPASGGSPPPPPVPPSAGRCGWQRPPKRRRSAGRCPRSAPGWSGLGGSSVFFGDFFEGALFRLVSRQKEKLTSSVSHAFALLPCKLTRNQQTIIRGNPSNCYTLAWVL